MNRKRINPMGYANTIEKAIPKGVLLTTKAEGKVNSMVIGWGMLGRVWSLPTFIAFVRTSRYTHEMLEKNPQFTINVPLDGRLPRDIFKVCGTQSGRDLNKVEAAGLTLVNGDEVDVPGIAQAPLTLECDVMYHALMVGDALPEDVRANFYPADVDDIRASGSRYLHEVYYGEIVNAYVIEE